MKKNMVIGFYSHPEYYPPALNALEYLSGEYDMIYIVHRNYPSFNWKFPANVKLTSNGKTQPIREVENSGTLKKIMLFLKFTWIFLRKIKKEKPHTVLLYDSLPVLAYCLIKTFIKKPAVLWYHNHDVTDLSMIKKYTIAWWAWRAEHWIFPSLAVFSLPAKEREACFPMDKLKGVFYFIPNFPSVKMYQPYRHVKKANDCFNLLYQGSIGTEHGLEELIPLLNKKIQQKTLRLILKGFISKEYLLQLQAIAALHGVENRLIYNGSGSYVDVIENASHCHIGIGIHKKDDIMNKTLGTASNKIYEYAALGMPVFLYDNIHFKTHLSQFSWAFFTDCSAGSLTRCLEKITADYNNLSKQAESDFLSTLNFEHFFLPVLDNLKINNPA